jgi:ATP-binding cassette subfamily F protein 3
MPVATLNNLTKGFGHKALFEKLNLNVYRGQRIGLIGANGSGKTTLLRILLGQVAPDDGAASIRKSVSVGYLEQNPSFTPGNTVMDEAEDAFADLHRLSHRLRDLEHEMAHLGGDELAKVLEKYQHIQHEFELAGGYAWRHRLEATLHGVGLNEETWEQKVETLSGGQRSRLALARTLVGEPDVLLMDEPTNHLDLAALEWLESYLLDYKGAVLLISHDRYLLDRLATRIAWLQYAKLTTFDGNYSHFVTQRELMELTQARAYEEQQEDIEKQKEFIRRFGAGQRSKEAKGREKRLDRLLASDEMIAQVRQDQKVHISFDTQQRAGDRLLNVRDLTKSYGENRLWDGISFDMTRGERVGIIGPNGSGKTTFLETLIGRRDADRGTVRWGTNITLGYYDQNVQDLNEQHTAFEEVMAGRKCHQQVVRDMLGALLLCGDQADKPIGVLSGGERARVRLAQLLLDKPNVLVLDEPTNHLDIAACEALERTLTEFPGTILCVSHDRYFLDKIVGRLLVLRPPSVVDFDGNYSAWHQRCLADAAAASRREAAAKEAARDAARQSARAGQAKAPAGQKAKGGNAQNNAYLRPFGRLGLKEIEREMKKLELAISACQAAFADPATYRNAAKSRKIQNEQEALQKKLDQLEAEYLLRIEAKAKSEPAA